MKRHIDILNDKLEEKRVCIGVEHSNAVAKVILREPIELVHLELAILKNTEAVLEWLVDFSQQFAHFNTNELIIKCLPVDTVRFLESFLDLFMLFRSRTSERRATFSIFLL